MRAFVRLRVMLATHADLARRLNEHDEQFRVVFETIGELMTPKPVHGEFAITAISDRSGPHPIFQF